MIRESMIPVLLGLALGLLGPSARADAQVTATVVTKSGERYTGRDLGYRVDRREVAIRTSQNEEPRIPVDQVVYVDFGGTPDVQVGISGSENALVMRDGRVIKGQAIELGHVDPRDNRSPFLVIFRNQAGEEQRLNVNQVGRVYFSEGTTAVRPGGAPPSDQAGGITVSGRQQWTPTGMTVRRGEWLTLNATGEIRLSNDPGDVAVPTGSKIERYLPRAPMPGVLAGALIGRIGMGQPFGIGSPARLQMPADGQLFLGVNDSDPADNQGSFRVEIQRAGQSRRR